MRIVAIIACLALVATFACQTQSGGNKNTSSLGYEYILHTANEGTHPQDGDFIYFHAQVRNGDSVVFASREQGQEPFLQIGAAEKEGRDLSPVEDVLKELSVGDSVTILIALDTLPQKPIGFEDADVMYYDVVFTNMKTEADYTAEMEKIRAEGRARAAEVDSFAQDIGKKYANGELADQIQTTASGLKYLIHDPGAGKKPDIGRTVKVHYYGMLPDGTVFDQSYERGAPIPFPLGAGRVIRGWDEGIGLLNEGAKATLFIPAELGYGATGSPPVIPPNSELIFYVELVEVN